MAGNFAPFPSFASFRKYDLTSYPFGVTVFALRAFMMRNVEEGPVSLFARLNGEQYDSPEDIPNRVLIPAFILTEITIGFRIGFLIYMPFIVIDMVVASVLMAMGMMMLPPAMISLPFKVLLFVMTDGWNLLIQSLVNTFR